MIAELLIVASSLTPNFNTARHVVWTPEKVEIMHVNECHNAGNGRRVCRVEHGWIVLGSFPDNPNWALRFRSPQPAHDRMSPRKRSIDGK